MLFRSNQMMLFPTEFRLATTPDGIRLLATPIQEIERLQSRKYAWSSLTAADANQRLDHIPPGPLHVKIQVSLVRDDELTIRYLGTALVSLQFSDLDNGHGTVEILIDKCVAEIFVDGGRQYIVREIPATTNARGLEFEAKRPGSIFNTLDVYKMSSTWKTN